MSGPKKQLHRDDCQTVLMFSVSFAVVELKRYGFPQMQLSPGCETGMENPMEIRRTSN
jgi:hypothetical protein